MVVLNESRPVARKEYYCNACDYILNSFGTFNSFVDEADFKFPISELRALVKAKQDGYKIKKGERYYKQTIVDSGVLYTVRSKIDVVEICFKYEIFED